MNTTILCIPADNEGNKLWVKNFKEDRGRFFAEYKSTYNDMPFRKTELFLVEGKTKLAITGTDGTTLFRFSPQWVTNFL